MCPKYSPKIENLILALMCLIIISHVSFAQEDPRFNYCDLSCNGTENTMCKYKAGGGPNCANNVKVYLTITEKKYIEDNLNRIRDHVALGQVDGLPTSSNMMKLVWDAELSMMAKRWADQCDEGKHDECRLSQGDVDTGQTVYFGRYKKKFAKNSRIKNARLKEALEVWEDEKKLMNRSWIEIYDSTKEDLAGNFTQIIWATTQFVGCGYTEFDMNTYVKSRLVCNFKRRGNIEARRIYREGPPCSKCPPKTQKSLTYEGMCWNGVVGDYNEWDPGSATRLGLGLGRSLLCWAWPLVVLLA